MKLGTNDSEKYTAPRATGTPFRMGSDWGAVGTPKKVSLPQWGGEGVAKGSAKKSDMNLPQWGGEGGGKDGVVKGKSNDQTLILAPKAISDKYNGPGRGIVKGEK